MEEKLHQLPKLKYKTSSKVLSLDLLLFPEFDEYGNGKIRMEYTIFSRLLPYSGTGFYENQYSYRDRALKLTKHIHQHKSRVLKNQKHADKITTVCIDFLLFVYVFYLFGKIGTNVYEPTQNKSHILISKIRNSELKLNSKNHKLKAVLNPFLEELSFKVKPFGYIKLVRYGLSFKFSK